jgi:hypothetical protein
MQTLSWRFRRLLGMSPREVAWRARGALIDLVDAQRAVRGRPPRARSNGHGGLDRPGFRVCDLPVGAWAALPADDPAARWCRALRARADAAAANRPAFFGAERDLGTPPDWNRDPESGRPAPRRPAMLVDYRDYAVVGDIKMVWEPNRHHHLVVLARAWRATGERRYAEAVRAQLQSWLEQCPYGYGVNWRSPLELAIRLINWVWALDLVRESGAIDAGLAARLQEAAYLHLFAIARRYSRGSSANNHRVGEAAGVFIGSSYFDGFAGAERWREESLGILGEEILAQTGADGGHREHALGYHVFVLQFFQLAALVAQRTGVAMPAGYRARLERMHEYLGAFLEGGEELPLFGDADEGYVLDLGPGGSPARGLLAVGAVLFGRPEFKAAARDGREPVRWLCGRAGESALQALAAPAAEPLASRAFAASGYYLLQCGRRAAADAVSVTFDCAELGFGAIAAHGHADALGFTLRAFGRDVLVDPGTYDYFRYPAWRDYFRSTRAHNTVEVDGQDQSVMQGLFLWGARARARCLDWSPTAAGGSVRGEHDGYRRLADPVVHRRRLDLEGRTLAIEDELAAGGAHEARLFFHFSEHCAVESRGAGRFRVETGRGAVTLVLDPRLTATLLRGSEDPIGGWVSRGYHRKVPATTVVATARWQRTATFRCRVEIGDSA